MLSYVTVCWPLTAWIEDGAYFSSVLFTFLGLAWDYIYRVLKTDLIFTMLAVWFRSRTRWTCIGGILRGIGITSRSWRPLCGLLTMMLYQFLRYDDDDDNNNNNNNDNTFVECHSAVASELLAEQVI